MSVEKRYKNVVTPKEENKREITKLAELDRSDKNTIYNLIFAEPGRYAPEACEKARNSV